MSWQAKQVKKTDGGKVLHQHLVQIQIFQSWIVFSAQSARETYKLTDVLKDFMLSASDMQYSFSHMKVTVS